MGWASVSPTNLVLYIKDINLTLFPISVNPKEYLELLKDIYVNKKHKGIKKGWSGLGFENFAERIKSLVDFDTFEKP